MIRVGNGFDLHKLVEGRRLILGGVDIPFEKGLEGHSDADVLSHSIMDALLGAIGKRDIGFLFPDNDMSYKDISSLILLERVKLELEKTGYTVGNIDSIIVAQKPRLSSYIDNMKKNIAKSLGISYDTINIKATTTEGIGCIGRQEGISSYAVVCLYKQKDLGD